MMTKFLFLMLLNQRSNVNCEIEADDKITGEMKKVSNKFPYMRENV